MIACESLDLSALQTPVFVIDLKALEANLSVLGRVREEANCTVLLALKGFATWATFPLVGRYLDGVAASSPDEARLGREKLGKEVHTYSPAFDERSLREVLEYSDHVIFNSVNQLERFASIVDETKHRVGFGLRVNPEHSEVDVAIYDPCASGSRLGATADSVQGADLSRLDGIHFHTLCELGVDALERTLPVVEQRFAKLLEHAKWANFGGGHHITRPDYDVDRLIELVTEFSDRHRVAVVLEPGEAIGLNTGVLVASVLDVVENDGPIAILDTSATAHMPDVLEMPYRPSIRGAAEPRRQRHTYRLGGLTCLAGDVIGEYSFPEPLRVGQRLVFEDMAHYTMVKTTTFNGARLPSIAVYDPRSNDYEVKREFGYEDYRDRLS